ncbi:l-aminoadipate-semialdehyde dehydrogenase large subunit [Fusarium flagelliforme]|uniref:L-aminoadipate-semialdehyde dehydrogenase large subunit n=2 Tax=Fusarium flagelliforme TaxID=2675880 RepID=A0A395MFQ1_9HYPO|nr:l-aminoadipate-semialdehyde dehydrogenase large subunit [Fusarium flagelliforme]
MAPVLENTDLMSITPNLHIRSDKCYSWDCLTPSEQAGIIVSIVATSAILLFAYMYYLGRLTDAHRQLTIRRQRRNRAQRATFIHFHEVSLVQLPVVPQYPSENVLYAPFVYHPEPLTANYQPATARVIIPSHTMPTVVPAQPTTYVHVPVAGTSNDRVENSPQSLQPTPSISLSTPSDTDNTANHEREWWKRLCRVLGLPVGRASTIASDSIPNSPVIPQHRAQRSSSSRSGPESVGHNPTSLENQGLQPNTGNPNLLIPGYNGTQHSPMRGQSPASVAATVHSDDFDIVSN